MEQDYNPFRDMSPEEQAKYERLAAKHIKGLRHSWSRKDQELLSATLLPEEVKEEASRRFWGSWTRGGTGLEIINAEDIMSLIIEGTVKHKLAVQSGTSANGQWAKQEFVVEYQDGNYPSSVCFTAWGQNLVDDLARIQEGQSVKVSFSVKGREWNGRWYNDLRAYKIESDAAPQPAVQEPAPQPNRVPLYEQAQNISSPGYTQTGGSDDEELPF